jgi:hypothetical protein
MSTATHQPGEAAIKRSRVRQVGLQGTHPGLVLAKKRDTPRGTGSHPQRSLVYTSVCLHPTVLRALATTLQP